MTTTVLGSELARRFQLALREIEYGLEEVHAAQGVDYFQPRDRQHSALKQPNAFDGDQWVAQVLIRMPTFRSSMVITKFCFMICGTANSTLFSAC